MLDAFLEVVATLAALVWLIAVILSARELLKIICEPVIVTAIELVDYVCKEKRRMREEQRRNEKIHRRVR